MSARNAQAQQHDPPTTPSRKGLAVRQLDSGFARRRPHAALLVAWVACAEFASPSDTVTITSAGASGGGTPQGPRPIGTDAPRPIPSPAPGRGPSSAPDAGLVQNLDDAGRPDPMRADAATTVSPDASVISNRAVRFVRLVADSAVSGEAHTSIADFNLIGENAELLPRGDWIASADDAEPIFLGGAPARNAIDADRDSLWHTSWFELVEPPGHPHYLQVDLGGPQVVIGFRYRPRQDHSTGRIAVYRFFVSNDAEEWGEPVAVGVFPNTTTEQEVRLLR